MRCYVPTYPYLFKLIVSRQVIHHDQRSRLILTRTEDDYQLLKAIRYFKNNNSMANQLLREYMVA